MDSDYSVLLVSDREGFFNIFADIAPRGEVGKADTMESAIEQCGRYSAVVVDCDSVVSDCVFAESEKINRPIVYVVGKNQQFLDRRMMNVESCVVFSSNVDVVKKHVKYACDSFTYHKTSIYLKNKGEDMVRERTFTPFTRNNGGTDTVKSFASLLTYDGSPAMFMAKSVHIISRILNTDKVATLIPVCGSDAGFPRWSVANAIGFEGRKINIEFSGREKSLCGTLFRHNRVMLDRDLRDLGELSETGYYELNSCFDAGEIFIPVLSVGGPLAVIVLGRRLSGAPYSVDDIDLICSTIPYFVKTFFRLVQKEIAIKTSKRFFSLASMIPYGVLITNGNNVVYRNVAFSNIVPVSATDDVRVTELGSKVSNFVFDKNVETEVFGGKKYKIDRHQLPDNEQLFILTETPLHIPSVN